MNSIVRFLSLIGLIGLASCDSVSDESSRGPIVLGDSATIITETDTQYMGDLVLDLEEKDLGVANNPVVLKDTFRNVEQAQQLAAQQKKDSINAARKKAAAAVKPKTSSAPKKKTSTKSSTKKSTKKTTAPAKKKTTNKKRRS